MTVIQQGVMGDVICRIGSLENHAYPLPERFTVICRIGSLENAEERQRAPSARYLPYRQLRKPAAPAPHLRRRYLPYRQLRKKRVGKIYWQHRYLPYRQLRNSGRTS